MQTALSAVKERMFSLLIEPTCADSASGMTGELAENTHPGLASENRALFLGQSVCNSTTALGLRGTLFLNRVRSRCTGKERDAESGLDNFGARYDASSLGRFMTPDPVSATPLHLVNPQRWNMYSYVVNNPETYIDPDGRDAIAVNLSNEVPLGGHEGIIVVHRDGSATYARFGPAHAGSSVDKGKVTVQSLNPVKLGSNGLPTDASYKELATEVGKVEGEPASTVGFNYFKTSETDTILLDNWVQAWKTAQAPDYNVTSQNCATFCIAGLIQGGAIQNKNISIIPNRLFMLLGPLATENWTWQGRTPKEKVTHKICDDKGNNCH